jgi:exosome complex component RRP40
MEETNLSNDNKIAADNFLKTKTNKDFSFNTSIVYPGDNVTSKIMLHSKNNAILGVGLHRIQNYDGDLKSDTIIAVNVGMLKFRSPSTFWVESNCKRYFPLTGDQIVGLIEDKGSDYYKVNIFSTSSALLSRLGFEGATKRNKPELKKGDIVYARVSLAHKDLETELTCTASSGSKKEWSSGEAVYGKLCNGVVVKMSIGKAKSMLLPDCVVLNTLGRHFSYEVAVGMNGAVWIRAPDIITTIIIRNALLNSEFLDDHQIEAMVDELAKQSKESAKESILEDN